MLTAGWRRRTLMASRRLRCRFFVPAVVRAHLSCQCDRRWENGRQSCELAVTSFLYLREQSGQVRRRKKSASKTFSKRWSAIAKPPPTSWSSWRRDGLQVKSESQIDSQNSSLRLDVSFSGGLVTFFLFFFLHAAERRSC